MNELAQHTVERLEYAFEVSRRDLFKLLGAGLVVGLCSPTALTQESGARARGESTPQDVNSWLHINPDGIEILDIAGARFDRVAPGKVANIDGATTIEGLGPDLDRIELRLAEHAGLGLVVDVKGALAAD